MAISVVTDISAAFDARNLSWSLGTLAVGDVIVCSMFTEDATFTQSAPTATGVTFTQRVADTTASHTADYVFTGVVTSAGAKTVTSTATGVGSVHMHGGVCVVLPTADGYSLAATPNTVDTRGSGGPSGSITGTSAGNLIVGLSGDWAAVDGASRTYRGTTTEDGYMFASGRATAYFWHQTAAAGANTIGLSAPVGQTYTIVGVEVLKSGGGTAYTGSPADTVGLLDAATAVQGLARAPADPVGLLDTAAAVQDNVRTITDTVGLLDTVTAAQANARTVADLLGITDAVTAGMDYVRVVTDLIGISDAAGYTLDLSRLPADLVGILDAASAVQAAARGPADTAGITDTVTAVMDAARTVADTVGITDSVSAVLSSSGNLTATPADTVGITDAVSAVQVTVRGPSDLEGILDTVTATQDLARAPADLEGITDAATAVQGMSRAVADPVGITDAVTAFLSRVLTSTVADGVGITDSVTAVLTSGAALPDVGILRVRMGRELWTHDLGDKWRHRIMPDRWRYDIGGDMWARRTEHRTVKQASDNDVELQINPPVDLTGGVFEFCFSPTEALPSSPAWATATVPTGTKWIPGTYSSIIASTGPGALPLGTVYFHSRVTLTGRHFIGTHGFVTVEA